MVPYGFNMFLSGTLNYISHGYMCAHLKKQNLFNSISAIAVYWRNWSHDLILLLTPEFFFFFFQLKTDEG